MFWIITSIVLAFIAIVSLILNTAYEEIKDRKGVMSSEGSFIKEADL